MNLHNLWQEYEFGFAGYKAAKDFTSRERGADKCKYYRRNIFWSKVNELVLAGHSADEACDLIYRAYGQSCFSDQYSMGDDSRQEDWGACFSCD